MTFGHPKAFLSFCVKILLITVDCANKFILRTKTNYTSNYQRQWNHLKIGIHLVPTIIRPTVKNGDQEPARQTSLADQGPAREALWTTFPVS